MLKRYAGRDEDPEAIYKPQGGPAKFVSASRIAPALIALDATLRIIGPEAAIRHLTNLATHTTYGVPGYIQDASRFALELGEDFEAEIAAPFVPAAAGSRGSLVDKTRPEWGPVPGPSWIVPPRQWFVRLLRLCPLQVGLLMG